MYAVAAHQWLMFVLLSLISAACLRKNISSEEMDSTESKELAADKLKPRKENKNDTNSTENQKPQLNPRKPPVEEAKTQCEVEEDPTQKSDVEKKEEWIPYPVVKECTRSAKKRRAEELRKDRLMKIAQGFYQTRSDVDDTLDQVQSLEMERTEKRRIKWLASLAK
ncbi:hypothetical protein RB195_012138 [Necator americanus]|uniref:Secreted protein n=1 Tax=Necator americanus TaxID=51031 RepID=A0ABR1D5P1_NECAM